MRVINANDTGATIELTTQELRIVVNALNEVCNGPDAIEDWEFSNRLGVGRRDAEKLLDDLGRGSP